MTRNLPGKITREAPPGPEMTEAQFREALEAQRDDAARWRYFKRHFVEILDTWKLENMNGWILESNVDQARK